MTPSCLACGHGQLVERLDLGPRHLATFPITPDALPGKYPLQLLECERCRVVQLGSFAPLDELYSEYWYRSGVNEAMIAELHHVAGETRRHLGRELRPTEWLLDIAANDGTLLKAWPRDTQSCAVEPSPTFAKDLVDVADLVVQECFPTPTLAPLRSKCAAISACAVFYASRDPKAFVQQIADLLAPDGVCVIQMQDLLQQLQQGAWDNICHEHVAYYSLHTLADLLGPDLYVYDLEVRPINGGSLRFWIDKGRREVTDRCKAWWAKEEGFVQDRMDTLWAHFRLRQEQSVAAVREVLQEATHRGATVHQYGASTKAATFTQVAGLGPDLLPLCWERSPAKVGRFTVSGAAIVDEPGGRAIAPDFLLSTIWQFKDSTVVREQDYLAAGGKLLFGLPRLNWIQHGATVARYQDARATQTVRRK